MFLFCSYFFYIFAGQTTTQSQLMIMDKSSFFKPYRGEKYETGINGKKILVVGASFYCTDKSCKFFTKCTDVIKKDSSNMMIFALIMSIVGCQNYQRTL